MMLFPHFGPKTPHPFVSSTCLSVRGWRLLLNHFCFSSSLPPPRLFCLAVYWTFPSRRPTGTSHWGCRNLTSSSPCSHLCLLTSIFPSVIPIDINLCRVSPESHPWLPRVRSPVNSSLSGLLTTLYGYWCFLEALVISHQDYFCGSHVTSLSSASPLCKHSRE